VTDGASTTALTGRELGNRYRLERLLATGGMAQVWEATDKTLARKVAVKLLHPHLAADASFVERFRREALAAARLSHTSIVSIYDTCSEEQLEAIVMELVHGRTLRQYLDEHHVLEPTQAIAIVAEVADALETAHRSGVVHRDVKPGNILLSSDGRVLVADFGIATAGSDLTSTNTLLGTAKYLAPEQVEGHAVDARADVYALGVVLYEALCGRVPFTGDTEAATALARLHSEPLRPRNVRAGIPKELEEVVMRALARDPDQRYPSASAFRAALLAAARAAPPEPVPVPLPVPSRDPTVATSVTGAGVPADATPPRAPPPAFVRTERGWLVPALVIVLAGAALILAGVLVSGGTRSNSTPPGTTGTQSLAIARVGAFDPPPGDGEENDADVRNVTDGDPATVWQTTGYDSRNFGRLKPGVGLVLTLDHPTKLAKLSIDAPTNDWAVQIYVSDSTHPDLAGYGEPVASRRAIPSGTTSYDLGGRQGSVVLVWITDLGDGALDNGGRVHARIAEIDISATTTG